MRKRTTRDKEKEGLRKNRSRIRNGYLIIDRQRDEGNRRKRGLVDVQNSE